MILREIFYFDKETVEPTTDYSYLPSDDKSVVDFNDTRVTRLTLAQINKARKASELHQQEKEKELEFIQQMYGTSGAEGEV